MAADREDNQGMKYAAAVLCVALLLTTSPPLGAWGEAGHRVVSRAAIKALPGEVPQFLLRQIDWIGGRSVLADSWRGPHEPFSKAAEDPNHVWYTEQFAFMKEIPRSRDAFVLAVYDEYLRLKDTDPERAARTNIHYTGTLPYAATEGYERLKVSFRTWRDLQTRRQDTTFIEQDAAFYTGWMSHYVADAAMPLHSSIHHDGWTGDNPKNYTRDGGIHWLFENTFVDLIGLDDAYLQPRIDITPKVLDDPFTAMLAHLDRAHTRVEQVYILEQRKAFADKTDQQARDLVFTTLGEASTLVRDLIYTAWIRSSDGQPSFDPNDQTNNPKNPRYNPATGSAPPPLPVR